MKFAFMPISIAGGIVAGFLGKKLFVQLWGVVDDQQPPDAKHRDISWGKLVAALVLEGAIFRLVRGLFDHSSRQGFARLTGTWPGEERPEPE